MRGMNSFFDVFHRLRDPPATPANVNPPRAPSPEADTTSSVAAAEPAPAAPAKPKAVYSTASVAPAKPVIHAVTKPQPAAAKPQPQTDVAQMTAPPANSTPSNSAPPNPATRAASPFPDPPPPAQGSGMMTGATPVVPSGSFEGRWGGMR